jgi:hypothetical protein
MLLDGNHLLLADEAVPAPQRLGVVGRIGIIGGHVAAHDRGGVRAMSSPVRKRFWRRMRATLSAAMPSQWLFGVIVRSASMIDCWYVMACAPSGMRDLSLQPELPPHDALRNALRGHVVKLYSFCL